MIRRRRSSALVRLRLGITPLLPSSPPRESDGGSSSWACLGQADVRNWFNYIGPQFVGELGLINMRIFAKGDVGFVCMHQTYEGTLDDGKHFFWKMRQTDVVQKIDGKWKILHTHLSFAATPQAKHPDSWVVDFEMPPRPLPWTVSEALAGG